MKNAQLSENRPFVGREQELSTLLQLYDQISPHWPLVVLLYGPSGVGKSSLMREFLQRLGRRTPETVLISTTCPEWKVEPFTALHGLLQTLSDLLQGMTKDKGLALLPQHYELLHNFFPQFNQVEIFKGKDEIRYQYSPRELLNMSCTALRSLLASILKTYRFVMTINEIQWIDADSLKVLRTILQPPHAPPLCLLGSISTLEGDGDPEPLVAKIADQLPLVVRKISVTPLPPEEAGLVASNSLSNIEEMHSKIDAVTNIVRCSKGHPLLIEEMGIRIGNLKVQLDLAKFLDRLTLAETLWTRICALEEKKQNLVEVVGLCGVPVIKNVLKHFLGMEGDNLARSIDELFHERLLRPTRFLGEEAVEPYHNWVRRTIMANMSVEKQHLTHQALANAYERLKTCLPGILSWHYGYSHDFRAAGQFAAQAAERAYAALAYDLAVDFFRKAIEALAGDNEFRRKLQRRLAEALIGSFRSREAAQAYLSAVPGAAPLEALSLQKLACDQLLFCGQVSEAFHLIQELLITLGINLPKSAKGTLFSLLIRRVRIRLGGLNFHICTNESELPPQDLIQADICYSMGLVLSIIDHIAGADFNSRFFLLALKLGEPHRVLSALAVEANFIASAGKTDSRYYRKIVAKTEDLLKTHDEPNALAYLTFAEALSSYMAGEWPRAQKIADQAEKMMNFSFSGINWVAMIVRAISSWSLCLLGEFRKLTERVTTLVDQAFIQGNLTEVSTQMLGPNNLVYVCREGPDAAKKRIDDFMEHWTFPGYHLQHFLALTARATIDLYQGNSFNAYERIAEAWPNIRRTFMLLIPSVKSDIHFIRARAALAASVKTDPLEKKRLLAGAKKDANILHRLKRPYATCWAELVEAGLASIKGDKEHAADLLRKAIESASRCEMKLIKATAQWQLGSILHGAEGAALRKTAEIFMKRQRINEVKAMARVFVPGFSESE